MKASFDEYKDKYRYARMERSDGILEVSLHADGGPLIWGDGPHTELGYCFADIGSDPENEVIILTGTGEDFIARVDESWVGVMTPQKWDKIFAHGKRLLANLLDIEAPVIAAVNGPARVHAELAVLSDIVLAADTAFFQDAPHFRHGTVPSDGVHVIWPHLIGANRGRYFLLTGQKISASEALDLGIVNEVLPPDQLLTRARELARDLARQPTLTLRLTRAAFTQPLKRLVLDHVGFGLALEGLGAHESWPTGA
jgi:enoyl-CoA hydratase/carnithine racemase